jgi:cytochrome c oxidase subunit 2
VVALVWTVSVLAAVSSPAGKPTVVIEITAAQWWWKARYLDPAPSRSFTTANEIHIPVGQPVRIRLRSADVIHSFWVPALGGKTDTIPGQTNLTWLQANAPGTYRGQCTEFCGWQHAHMGLLVVAESPAEFRLWKDAQIRPAPPPASPQIASGRDTFEYRCGACHTVRGSKAGGSVAPDLTHLMSRTTLAAATLPHTIGSLSGWIANPQAIKPGARMPAMEVSGPELERIRTYLQTLK